MLMENMGQNDEKENEVAVPRPDVPAPADEHELSQSSDTGSGERVEQSLSEENSARLEMADKVEHAQSPYSFKKENAAEAKPVDDNASASPFGMVSVFLFTALLVFGLLGWFVAGELSKKMDQLSGTVSELSMVIAAGQAESRKGEVFAITAELEKAIATLQKVEKLGDEKATAKAKQLLLEAKQIVAEYEGSQNSAGK